MVTNTHELTTQIISLFLNSIITNTNGQCSTSQFLFSLAVRVSTTTTPSRTSVSQNNRPSAEGPSAATAQPSTPGLPPKASSLSSGHWAQPSGLSLSLQSLSHLHRPSPPNTTASSGTGQPPQAQAPPTASFSLFNTMNNRINRSPPHLPLSHFITQGHTGLPHWSQIGSVTSHLTTHRVSPPPLHSQSPLQSVSTFNRTMGNNISLNGTQGHSPLSHSHVNTTQEGHNTVGTMVKSLGKATSIASPPALPSRSISHQLPLSATGPGQPQGRAQHQGFLTQ